METGLDGTDVPCDNEDGGGVVEGDTNENWEVDEETAEASRVNSVCFP